MNAVEFLSQPTGLGIGLTGAHRTGKTTIVDQLCEKNPFPAVRSSVSAIAAERGFEFKADNTLSERIEFQEHVLQFMTAQYEAQLGIFFTDRTPMDMAAYMLADVRAGEIDPELDKRVQAYVERCIEVTNRHFSLVIAIQPGIPYVAEEGKPALNASYQEEVGALIVGLCATRLETGFRIMARGTTDRQSRVNAVASMTTNMLATFYSSIRRLPLQ